MWHYTCKYHFEHIYITNKTIYYILPTINIHTYDS